MVHSHLVGVEGLQAEIPSQRFGRGVVGAQSVPYDVRAFSCVQRILPIRHSELPVVPDFGQYPFHAHGRFHDHRHELDHRIVFAHQEDSHREDFVSPRKSAVPAGELLPLAYRGRRGHDLLSGGAHRQSVVPPLASAVRSPVQRGARIPSLCARRVLPRHRPLVERGDNRLDVRDAAVLPREHPSGLDGAGHELQPHVPLRHLPARDRSVGPDARTHGEPDLPRNGRGRTAHRLFHVPQT